MVQDLKVDLAHEEGLDYFFPHFFSIKKGSADGDPYDSAVDGAD